MTEPILITGCARSGTSMIAGIINICGAFGGNMSGPNRNNAKGMFENAYIRNSVVKPYYESINVDKLGQYPLPDAMNVPIPPIWRDRIHSVMDAEGYIDGPWMYKGAKMCQHWPVWNFAFPEAKWVVVRRKTPDIIRSCMRTGFMRAFRNTANQRAVGVKSEYDGWLWWVHYHEARWAEMKMEGIALQEVWPERMVDNDYSQVEKLINWLGLEWREDEVRAFIEPKLWKAKHKR